MAQRAEGGSESRASILPIDMLERDPLAGLDLPAADAGILAEHQVATLRDWVSSGRHLPVSAATASLLDARARLTAAGINADAAAGFIENGIDSISSLASLDAAARKRLSGPLGLDDDKLADVIKRAGDTERNLWTNLAGSLLRIRGYVPGVFSRNPPVCGVCRDDTSIVGRYRYFLYLVAQTGKSRALLDETLHQDLPAITAQSGNDRIPQLQICNEVLARRYGALTDEQARPGRRLLISAILGAMRGSARHAAEKAIAAGALGVGADDLTQRLTAALLGDPDVVFTAQEAQALEKAALEQLTTDVAAERDFGGASADAIAAEAARRLQDALADARRRVLEADREGLKQRSGAPPKSDYQFFRELCIETGLGACEITTRLDQAIASLQAYLDEFGTSPDRTVNGRPYLTYEQWRGEQLGYLYPDLRALLRDDVLTGEDGSWDRGSIVRRRATDRSVLGGQLNDARSAIQHGYLAEDQERARVVNGSRTPAQLGLTAFTDSPYFSRFQQGMTAIDLVLDADDKIAKALDSIDADEPGLAVAHLNDATGMLDQLGELAFQAGSDLLTGWRLSYHDLAALPAGERRERIRTIFEQLFSATKDIYRALSDGELQIPGLDPYTGFITDPSEWSTAGLANKVGVAAYVQFVSVPNPAPHDDAKVQEARTLNRANNPAELTDNLFQVYFSIQSNAPHRTPAVTDHYAPFQTEKIGLTIRRKNGAGYRIVVETALTDSEQARLSRDVSDDDSPPPPPYRYALSIYKVDATGEHRQASSDTRFELVLDETYVLTVDVLGGTIRADLQTPDGEQRSVRWTDGSATAVRAGAFGVCATATLEAMIAPIVVSSPSAYSIPPFYSAQRESSNFFYLRSQSIYQRHVDSGKGMATNMLPAGKPLTYGGDRAAAERLSIRFDKRPGERWFLVFENGRRAVSLDALDDLLDRCLALSAYLRYAAIPTRLAQALTASGDFHQAETVMRVVFDDTAPESPLVYPAPSSPPALAGNVSMDERLMRLRMGEVLVNWAEWLFRQDTEESRRNAFRLSTRVLALYGSADFCACSGLPADLQASVRRTIRPAAMRRASPSGRQVVDALKTLDALRGYPHAQLEQLTTALEASRKKSGARPALLEFDRRAQDLIKAPDAAPARQGLAKEAEVRALAFSGAPRPAGPAIDYGILPHWPFAWDLINYCIPANPVGLEHRQRACLILSYLRHCQNVLGHQDDVVPPLRFDALLARARAFADLALSAERDLMTFRDRFEAESFSLLQAQSAVEVADASVALEGMRIALTESEIVTARLQQEKTQASESYYEGLVDGGLSDWEQRSLNTARAAITWSGIAFGAGFATNAAGVVAGAAGGPAALLGAASTLSSVPAGIASELQQYSEYYAKQAGYERRAEEWQFQAQMARFDVMAAETLVDQAFQRRDIAVQQQAVASLQRDAAVDALHFLNNKFLNAAMYLWMMKTVRDQYRKRLDYAIHAAYMAERALAFEMVERVKVIRFDYFDPRRDGLLGASTLQTDLATLAHLKLTTTKRKLQLTKSISLVASAPVELDRFKYGTGAGDLGRLRFRTLMEWFDTDFPGHYLRLIKAVKVTVIALVPPLDGIRATLRCGGISKVVVGGPPFKERVIKRPEEAVALSAPYQASGVFALNYEDELLLPFEGHGVEAEWSFEMPKASNQFDYSTIADIYLTVDYTALSHDDYRQDVVGRLDPSFSAERTFSLRHHFPDQWYELHHPDQMPAPMRVKWDTRRTDFPPNLDNVSITHVSLWFIRRTGSVAEIDVTGFTFQADDQPAPAGGAAATAGGVVSTRQASGANWMAMTGQKPFGKWDMTLADATRTRFNEDSADRIEEILLVVSYRGATAGY